MNWEVNRKKVPAKLSDVIEAIANSGIDISEAKVMFMDFILQADYIPKKLVLADIDDIVETIKTRNKVEDPNSIIKYEYTDLLLNI